MLPAREVGGDFYDFFLLDDTHLGIVVGDVSGKGVPAALFMAISRTLLKSVALTGAPPAECLRRVNALLCLDNSAEMFVTVFYGVLHTRTGGLEYSNGGHNPPYLLRREGALEVLPGTGGIVLGVLDDVRSNAKTAVMRPGDTIFLYSDGVTEAMDSDGNLFSDSRLQAALQQCGATAAATVIPTVLEAVSAHAAGAPQSDDITAMAIRYHGASQLA
jgi:sigma-B regulation protein RsbU (phosphoserine phosphatase)